MKEDKKEEHKVNQGLPLTNVEISDPQDSIYWIQTYTSNKFYFEGSPENIAMSRLNIHDIAHPLSQIVRFSGHLQYPLTVAQHSLTVMAIMEKDGYGKKALIEALMHDCHEAMVGDMPNPLKNYLYVNHNFDFRRLEMQIRERIYDRFGIENENEDIIKKYDLICCKTEAHSLFNKVVDNWTDKIPYKLQNGVKEILTPKMAKEIFIQQYKRLGGKL